MTDIASYDTDCYRSCIEAVQLARIETQANMHRTISEKLELIYLNTFDSDSPGEFQQVTIVLE